MEESNVTLRDLIEFIGQEEIEIRTIEGGLKDSTIGKIRRFLFGSDLEDIKFKICRDNIKLKVTEKIWSVNSAIKRLNDACIFDFNRATQFMAAILSNVEGEEYIATNLRPLDTFAPIYIKEVPMCLIATIANTRDVCDLYNRRIPFSPQDLKDASEVICKDKHLLFNKKDKYSFFDCSKRKIPHELTQPFPYLTEIVADLINLRLNSPELTEEQAINIILEQIPIKYGHLLKSENVTDKTGRVYKASQNDIQ